MPISPVSPTEPFDPLEQLLNSRISQANAADAALTTQQNTDRAAAAGRANAVQSLALNGRPVAFTPAGGSLSVGVLDVFRIGGAVQLSGVAVATVANFLCTETPRRLGNIAAAGRPALTVIQPCIGVTVGSELSSRVCELMIEPNGDVWLYRWNGATHPAGSQVRIGAMFLTSAAHPDA